MCWVGLHWGEQGSFVKYLGRAVGEGSVCGGVLPCALRCRMPHN